MDTHRRIALRESAGCAAAPQVRRIGGGAVYSPECCVRATRVVFDVWEAEDNLLSTSLTDNGQTTDTYDTWGHRGWYYWGREVERTTTTYGEDIQLIGGCAWDELTGE